MNATPQSSQLQPSPIDIFTILPHIPPVVGIPLYFNSYKGLTYGYDPTLDVFIPMSYQQLVFIEENYLFHIYKCDFLASDQEFFEDPQDPTYVVT
ncbi:hypothetical protein NLJ89_g11592 [Agrocybe chaxingu]|uniref:Uncharacterized protein n=1 Tax=Agrocybe chaxingu TaxID=84603 RepID=A0A9W8MP88_9AGAR|nr:hypothetical protein NLJ89_g11592 [Agrocybe chaxingu]